MRIDPRLIIVAALLAAQPVASGEAGGPVAVTVTFGPALESKLGASYGTEEAEVLRACVVRSVGEALEQRRGGRPATPAASIAVVITAIGVASALPGSLPRRLVHDIQNEQCRAKLQPAHKTFNRSAGPNVAHAHDRDNRLSYPARIAQGRQLNEPNFLLC